MCDTKGIRFCSLAKESEIAKKIKSSHILASSQAFCTFHGFRVKAQNCSQDKQPLQMLMKYFRTFNPKNKTLIPAKNSEEFDKPRKIKWSGHRYLSPLTNNSITKSFQVSIGPGKHQCKQSF